MADREAKFWTRAAAGLWTPKAVLNRVENGVLDGMPDTYMVLEGVPGWAELKAPLEPARATTSLFSGNHNLTQQQRNWLLTHRQAGGRGWVLIETQTCMLMIGARHSDSINRATLGALIEMADFHCERPAKDVDWFLLTRVWSHIGKELP